MFLIGTKKGYYNITLFICEIPENLCTAGITNMTQYSKYVITPVEIYLTTKFPSPSKSNATGQGLSNCVIMTR